MTPVPPKSVIFSWSPCIENIYDNPLIPLQRVLKYHLLLRELMSNTASTHEEYHLIQQGPDSIANILAWVVAWKPDWDSILILRHVYTANFRTFSQCKESQAKTQVIFQAETQAEMFLLNCPPGLRGHARRLRLHQRGEFPGNAYY